MENLINNLFEDHLEISVKSQKMLNEKIADASEKIVNSLKKGSKLLFFGNGGSAGDAQHIAAEFTGRFVKERKALPAIALTTDTSALTAISNDYGYDRVFERQVEALANKDDILVGISTSGDSPNVLKALHIGRNKGCVTIGLSGRGGGKMNDFCDINIIVPSTNTARIQEMHILIGHIICTIVDNYF